jgi:hypothetical protein
LYHENGFTKAVHFAPRVVLVPWNLHETFISIQCFSPA